VDDDIDDAADASMSTIKKIVHYTTQQRFFIYC